MENPVPSPRTLKFYLTVESLEVLLKTRDKTEIVNPVELTMQDAQTLASYYEDKDRPYATGYWNAAAVCLEKLNGVRD